MYFEKHFDSTCAFFNAQFGDFTVRERQITKVRFEIRANDPSGNIRKLSSLFDMFERKRSELFVQEYSIAQTSLEQIFNQFASLQLEETTKPQGGAGGVVG